MVCFNTLGNNLNGGQDAEKAFLEDTKKAYVNTLSEETKRREARDSSAKTEKITQPDELLNIRNFKTSKAQDGVDPVRDPFD